MYRAVRFHIEACIIYFFVTHEKLTIFIVAATITSFQNDELKLFLMLFGGSSSFKTVIIAWVGAWIGGGEVSVIIAWMRARL